jgi:hypothetical protein
MSGAIWDPVLDRCPRKYRKFIQYLDGRGLLRFSRCPKEHVGLFFVLKKNGIDQRIIVDARRANRHFRTPPHVDLCTSEGISKIEVEVPATWM